ncbi:VOC family protein [Paenibacillus spongiae]|uniref:VOC family protein n=1 Tax=Paenibacillus spongiae TaxID=2909671 RepID=A0ABY5S217_9BACL|nr:VOC family protein [Paenibacillus spongiae]UVI27605.1 VOC family protein [Paenibacillus spongiae]
MFKKLECVCIHTNDIEKSLSFYNSMGLAENWKIERVLADGAIWTVIGLIFPESASSELVLSNHPVNKCTEVEILVDDVRRAHRELRKHDDIKWIRAPFATESGHVAVMEAPDGNVFVLVGK